jgi:ABC-type phosphate/phosphonate transport system substrate-binding protein
MNQRFRIPPVMRAIYQFLVPVVEACAFLLQIAVWVAGCAPEANAQKLISGEMTVGFMEKAFSGVNLNDALAAFKIFLGNVSRQRGYDLVVQTQIFDSASGFEKAIRDGKMQLAIIPSWDYLSMDIQNFVDPYFVAVDEKGFLGNYLLLTRRDSGLNSLADLRGKSVAVLQSTYATLSFNWIETTLLQQKIGMPDTFFSLVEKTTKASGAVLPVFFGKYNACVVDQLAFDTMKELNPQVGNQLQILASSEPLLSAVICLTKSGWMSAKHKEDTELALADLHKLPTGQQILTLFRVRGIVPFKPEYLESVKKLKTTRDRLAIQTARVKQEK